VRAALHAVTVVARAPAESCQHILVRLLYQAPHHQRVPTHRAWRVRAICDQRQLRTPPRRLCRLQLWRPGAVRQAVVGMRESKADSAPGNIGLEMGDTWQAGRGVTSSITRGYFVFILWGCRHSADVRHTQQPIFQPQQRPQRKRSRQWRRRPPHPASSPRSPR